METIIQPSIIFISIAAGFFFGAYWMFMIMYKTEENLKKELDQTKRTLDQYTNQYEDTGYEAY